LHVSSPADAVDIDGTLVGVPYIVSGNVQVRLFIRGFPDGEDDDAQVIGSINRLQVNVVICDPQSPVDIFRLPHAGGGRIVPRRSGDTDCADDVGIADYTLDSIRGDHQATGRNYADYRSL